MVHPGIWTIDPSKTGWMVYKFEFTFLVERKLFGSRNKFYVITQVDDFVSILIGNNYAKAILLATSIRIFLVSGMYIYGYRRL